ncbi:MAG: class I SAM-dependent methyltransferase [bacterium]
MENFRPYSDKNLKYAKKSIEHSLGYHDKGLEAYAFGLGIKSFKDFEGKKVLDLGAGAHLQFARGLERAGIKADVVSFSPAFTDKIWLNYIRDRKESDKIVAGMGEELPFASEIFDRVMCLDVVEHLHTRERYLIFLKEITRVLAPNGVAYIAPTAEVWSDRSASIIPKHELEGILKNKVDVDWQPYKTLKFFTLILRKKSI